MVWIGGKNYAPKRDHNHKTVERAFRLLGCTVADTSGVASGFPDLVVGFRGRDHKVEVKNRQTSYGRKGKSESQKTFERLWNGNPHVDEVWDEDDARILVEQWSKK